MTRKKPARTRVISVSDAHNTGMIHLDEEGNNQRKKFLDQEVRAELAHRMGKTKVYRCYLPDDDFDYFTEKELDLKATKERKDESLA